MPRKFVSRLGYVLLTGFSTRWSVGSVLFLVSWAVLMGPWTYARHLISGTRLPFTAAYFGSIALTLYFAIGVSKIDFLFLSLSFPVLDSVFGLYASSRCTPTIPPPHDTPLYISLFVAHSFPLTHTRVRMVALHNREKGNLAPFTSIAQYNLKPRLVLLRIHPTLHSAGLSALNLASVPRPTTARDLDSLSLTTPCPTHPGVTERGVQSHRDQSMSYRS